MDEYGGDDDDINIVVYRRYKSLEIYRSIPIVSRVLMCCYTIYDVIHVLHYLYE